jgi:hypothetical protein
MLTRVFPSGSAPVTRRRLLVGAVGVPLLLSASACTEDAPADLPADPDRDALQAARDVEAATLVSLENWPAEDVGSSAVTPAAARTVVSAHVDVLDQTLGQPLGQPLSRAPTASGAESYELDRTLSTGQVVALLDSAADAHTRALRGASPEISPLLASIAASDAALAAAIRQSSR